MGGGAWPFLVRGVICLVNSDNERDSNILIRCYQDYGAEAFIAFIHELSKMCNCLNVFMEVEPYLLVCPIIGALAS